MWIKKQDFQAHHERCNIKLPIDIIRIRTRAISVKYDSVQKSLASIR